MCGEEFSFDRHEPAPLYIRTQPGDYTVEQIAAHVKRHPEDLATIQHYEALYKDRRAVAEMQTDEDTLPEWIFNRHRQVAEHPIPPWADLTEDEKNYWKHEAQAVRRAVKRGGFKDHDPELSKR